MPDTVRYAIGQFAELGGVSAKTLRFYDELHLLRPAFVDPRTRYRYYLAQQLRDLAAILSLRELGVPLREICGLRKARGGEPMRRLLERRREQVAGSILAAKRSLRWIDSALAEWMGEPPRVAVVLKHRPAARIASVRAKVRTYAEMADIERQLFTQVPRQAAGELRGVLWHRCADSGCLEGEPFVELKRDISRRSFFDVKELPASTVASAYSTSEDTEAERAYLAVRKWMERRGLRLAGPKREIYLKELLEIQFPVQAA